LYQILNKHTGN